MQKTLNIRKLTEADASEYHAIRLRALQEHPEAFGQSYQSQLETPIEAVERRLRDISQSPHDFMLGLYVNGTLSGMVGFHRSEGEKVQHKGQIWGMYVASEAQGYGYGRALIAQALEIAKQGYGLEQISLAVITTNTEARSLYQSLGFESYGTERRAACVNGEYLDDDLMVLFLDS